MKNYLNRIYQLMTLLILGVVWMPDGFAFPNILADFQARYSGSTTDAANCAVCHGGVNNTGSPKFNPYGQALKDANVNFANVESLNSDGDAGGFTNLQEINANTQPGWCSGSGCANPPSNMPAGVVLDPPSGPSNTPPVANAGGTYSGVVGVAVSFNKATATDADNDTLSYSWTFGDGGTSNLLQPTHIYNSAQQFTATLTVNDGTVGVSSSATVTISAANTAPVANAGGPYTGEAGSPVQFTGSGTDADGDTLTYAWNFGDGTTGSGATINHTYASAGNYTATLTVNDGKVNSSPSNAAVTISAPPSNAAPVADAGGPYTGATGANIVFNGSGSSDPNGDALTYQWDFGDGASASGVSPSHAYAAAGSYTVTLTVRDPGALTDAATATATVTDQPVNQPPVADAGGPYAVDAGVSITFDGTGSSDPDGDGLTYAWDFGDTTTGIGASPAHTYATAGIYDLSLTVSDGQLTSSASATTVTVTDPAQPPVGAALYVNNCQACHGDPLAGPAYDDTLAGMRRITGARECTITASIYGTSVFPGGVPDMQGMQGMIGDPESAELATYLNSQAVTGEQRYVTTCAGCHGVDGSGGRSQISVLGLGAGATAAAIVNVNEMDFLACLPDSDVTEIEDFLLSKDVVNPPPAVTPSGGGGGALGWILLLGMLVGRFFPLASRKPQA